MTEEKKLYIIRPVNYKWVVSGVTALLVWQTVRTASTLLAQGSEGKTTQLLVYLLVLGLAFALKESAYKPIGVTESYCTVKTVMDKETIEYANVQDMELLHRKRERRNTVDLVVTRDTKLHIKDIAVYQKQDIALLIERIGSGSNIADKDIQALITSLGQVRWARG